MQRVHLSEVDKNLIYYRCIHSAPSIDVPALAWPGFRQPGLEEIMSQTQAKSQAWPGFGPSQGFWCICTISHFLTLELVITLFYLFFE
jgi:hypothetical protein